MKLEPEAGSRPDLRIAIKHLEQRKAKLDTLIEAFEAYERFVNPLNGNHKNKTG